MSDSLFVPALPVSAAALRLAPLPGCCAFPLDRLDTGGAHVRAYYLARNGVYHGLRALGCGAGDVVLMPAYHHGVEVQAVRLTGARVVFYRVDRFLQADLDDIEQRLMRLPNARVLYLTHVGGWAQPVSQAQALCRRYGLWLVEDCALALYSCNLAGLPLGSDGDLAIFSLYKSLAVPHGGLALCRAGLPPTQTPPHWSTMRPLVGMALRALARRSPLGGVVRSRVRWLGRRTVDQVLPVVAAGTSLLEPAYLELGAAPLVLQLARHSDGVTIGQRRRRNYHRLLDALGDTDAVRLGALPRAMVPLFLPLWVDDRQAALHRLWASGIEAIDFWSVGHPECALAEFPETALLRRHMIEIPIHQDLDDADIDRIASSLKALLGRGRVSSRWPEQPGAQRVRPRAQVQHRIDVRA